MGFTFAFTEDTDNNKGVTQTQSTTREAECALHTIGSALHDDSCFFSTELVRFPRLGFAIAKRALSDIVYEAAAAQMDAVESGNDTYQPAIVQAISTQSDLIPGIYEGGAKTWECSMDLVDYLHSHWDALRPVTQANGRTVRVLELGCGSALPGLYCLKFRGCNVTFQDYNADVLSMVTIPNVALNSAVSIEYDCERSDSEYDSIEVIRDKLPSDRAMFVSGDWGKLGAISEIKPHSYDLVLSSETIYTAENYDKLLDVMARFLVPGSGVALVAAKSTYFGCTGSMSTFFERAQQSAAVKEIQHVATPCESGVKREIVMLNF